MALKFGLGFPTCREGTAYPVPYVDPSEMPTIARQAEEQGFHALWGNDHLTTPFAIRQTQDLPPNFYEPLITFASLGRVTERIRFFLGVLVLPEREIILLAKQIATLDRLTNGRVMLGVGIGSYKEEFEAVHPERAKANRGRMLEEGIDALRKLFGERRVTYAGKYVRFNDVELAPKPVQQPFPIVVNAHADAALERVGRIADGWVTGGGPIDKTAEARVAIDAAARAAGRDPAAIPLHLQIWLSLGKDRDEAVRKLRRSQHWRRTVAMRKDISEEEHLRRFAAGNLIGDADEVAAQIRSVKERTGVDHLGVVMLGDTTNELLDDMDLFASRVMPAFAPVAV